MLQLTVREGRVKRTETVHNNSHPEWNEELQFIVDDPDTQQISVVVKDDDIMDDTVSQMLHITSVVQNVLNRSITCIGTVHPTRDICKLLRPITCFVQLTNQAALYALHFR